jgi:NADH-quinone oxidoreductase subunit L
MVIAGVYLGLIINDSIILLIDISLWFSLCWYHLLIITLIWSLLRAISVSDIKSIIAFSTISQISYMFLAVVLNPLLCLFHILIHALFKSLLLLLAGSLITVQSNSQSIYRMKINHSFIKIIFLMASCILILSISKEVIIHSIYYCLCFLGSVFTTIYSFKIYIIYNSKGELFWLLA